MARNGFRPTKSLTGAPWSGLGRKYLATTGRSATNNSGDIYIGDVVQLGGGATGFVEPMLTITTGVSLGVVVGVGTSSSETALNTENVTRYYDPDNLSKRYLAHDEAGYVMVVPAEDFLFSVESDIIDQVQGAVLDIAITGTDARGSRTTGNSIQYVTTAAGAGDVMIVEQEERPDNDISVADARYIVRFLRTDNSQTPS